MTNPHAAVTATSASPAPLALITGGSRGLGKSMALALAQRGMDVIITYRSAEKEARDVVASIEQLGRRGVALPLDVGDVASFDAFVTEVRAAIPGREGRTHLDFLVNNAGTGHHATVAETTERGFDEMVNVHFKGPYFLVQKLLPLLADGGRIVNVGSGLSRYSYPGQAAYGALKGAIDVLTRYLALELGPRRIAVNVVAPGGIETDFAGGAMRDPAMQQAVASQTALGRMGVPDDVGGVVALLLSPEARWINGQRIELTGGFSL